MNEQKVKKGKTAKKVDIITEKWCTLCAKYITEDTLVDKLEPIIPSVKIPLSEAHQQGQSYMATELKQITDTMLEQAHFVEKMNRLDELIEAAKKRDPVSQRLAPPPTQIMRGICCHEKEKELKRLVAEYEEIRRGNDERMTQLSAAKNELSSKIKTVLNEIEKFQKITTVVRSINQNELINLMSKMDLIPERT